MAVPTITVSFPKATPGSPKTRAVTSPVEWDHYYSGTRFSENQDIKMNRTQGVENHGIYDVEEEDLDENFVYGRLSPAPAPRRDSKTLSELNGYLPGYRFVGNRDIEMGEAGVCQGSFHEFTFEYPFLPAEDFEGFSSCWREDVNEADVSDSCFEESSKESSDTGGSLEGDNVSNAYGDAPRRLSNMEDTYWGIRKRGFDEYEQGQIEEDESDDVQLEEPCPEIDDGNDTPSDDEMDVDHVMDCGCCSDLYFSSTDAPHDHEYSLEDYTFQGDDVEIEEIARRLPTIPEEEEPMSHFPYGYAEYVPVFTHADEGFGAGDDSYLGQIVFVVQQEEIEEDSDPDEVMVVTQEEEDEDDNGPYFNEAQLDSAEVRYTFV
ncbi:uncharacterized protein FMAN_05480 [Fusarium mangiferae]|uniref:Uncharacterized protein n=1 Tax=Fusarium mangiferae TaxID=192010 RepID=A0A1L7SUI9_FUSMA|nr:uncharacterized protein FMAN_05480 [Fusarium mangiferae]CVK87573.1 uncharacterized protein FMAN_05480 [Fusarium mangiferae]